MITYQQIDDYITCQRKYFYKHVKKYNVQTSMSKSLARGKFFRLFKKTPQEQWSDIVESHQHLKNENDEKPYLGMLAGLGAAKRYFNEKDDGSMLEITDEDCEFTTDKLHIYINGLAVMPNGDWFIAKENTTSRQDPLFLALTQFDFKLAMAALNADVIAKERFLDANKCKGYYCNQIVVPSLDRLKGGRATKANPTPTPESDEAYIQRCFEKTEIRTATFPIDKDYLNDCMNTINYAIACTGCTSNMQDSYIKSHTCMHNNQICEFYELCHKIIDREQFVRENIGGDIVFDV